MTALLIILALFLALAGFIAWSLLRILAWADRADEDTTEENQP